LAKSAYVGFLFRCYSDPILYSFAVAGPASQFVRK
jgi:hypothetical protein